MSRDGNLQEFLGIVEIQDVLEREGVEYRETHGTKGPQFWVRDCPRCGNSNWKVYINQETGLGNCFSGDCEETFNKWKFIQALLDVDNRDTFRYIADLAKEIGWKPRKVRPVAATVKPKGLLELPVSYQIPIEGKNIKFLSSRGIDVELAEYFGLRYSQDGVFWYENSAGEMKMQNYAKRVIIPVYDEDDKLVSFQGRDMTGLAENKYMFPPAYPAHSYLYNGHRFKTTKPEHIVIGEGVFDVISTKKALDEDPLTRDILSVGAFGKHLTTDQLNILRSWRRLGLKKVTMMWDGEFVAANDALAAAAQIAAMGLDVSVALLPKGRDPNEATPGQVREAFASAIKWTRIGTIRIAQAIKDKYGSETA